MALIPPSIPLKMRRISKRAEGVSGEKVSLSLYRGAWSACVYVTTGGKGFILAGEGPTPHGALDDLGRLLGEAGK